MTYSKKKAKFLEANPACPVTGQPTTDIHHKYSRTGKLCNWVPGWVALSRAGHCWAHANPDKARAMGIVCEKGQWGNPPKEMLEAKPL